MTIVDFLDTHRPRSELAIALAVLREFKESHSALEDIISSVAVWVKLEQLQEYLEFLVEGAPLREDTIRYMEQVRSDGG